MGKKERKKKKKEEEAVPLPARTASTEGVFRP